MIQTAIHLCAFILAIVILLDLTEHLVAYTMALILLLVHAAIAFVRMLFSPD